MAAKFCGNCGKALVEGARFCTGCGSTAPDASTVSISTAEPAPPRPMPSAPVETSVLAGEEARIETAGYAPDPYEPDAPATPLWRNPAAIAGVCVASAVAILFIVLFMVGGDRGSRDERVDEETEADAAQNYVASHQSSPRCPAPRTWGALRSNDADHAQRPVNVVSLDEDAISYWNNVRIDPSSLEHYIRITTQMNPVPALRLDVDPDASCDDINSVIELITNIIDCTAHCSYALLEIDPSQMRTPNDDAVDEMSSRRQNSLPNEPIDRVAEMEGSMREEADRIERQTGTRPDCVTLDGGQGRTYTSC